MAADYRLWRWRTADRHELALVWAAVLDERDVLDARGVERTSKFIERSFVVNRDRDGVRAGQKRRGEHSALARGVYDHRGKDADGDVSPNDNVVRERP